MAINPQVRLRAEELVGSVLLVVAIGGGTYLVGDGVGELRFVEVGWWNIRDLSSASRTDEEIQLIADGILGLHVLAIGELNDPAALDRIATQLGPSWRWSATEEKIGRTPHSSEYYGFLWDSEVVDMVGEIGVDEDPEDDIDREPAWATFRTTDDNLDFTLMCVHITWGDRVAARKAEIIALPEVWQRAREAVEDDRDLILVGDFNRNIGDDSFEPLLSISGMICANEGSGPTHVSSSTTYDQIFLSWDHTREWTGEYDTYAFDEELFGDDDTQAKLACSDHRPVWISLYVPEEDDD